LPVAELHDEAPHEVPLGAVQVPLPAHEARVQPATLSVQVPCGSMPTGTLEQVPLTPPVSAAEQALQPLQLEAGVSQQTVSTQLPVKHMVPVEQVMPLLSCGVQVLPAPQYSLAAQSVIALQPHMPLARQILLSLLLAQGEQMPPERPQAVFAVPGWQALPSQQPPLQPSPPVQSVEQWLSVLQAWLAGQFDAMLQPQVPPPPDASAMHLLPLVLGEVQLVQLFPVSPQAVSAMPVAQVPAAQQPPLHWKPPTQLVEHSWVEVLQALPVEQSPGRVQPHLPPPAVVTQAWLSAPIWQFTQALPVEPQVF
jgi:hypothetical protein